MVSELRQWAHYLWIRKGVLLGYLVLVIALGFTFLELQGHINLIPTEGNSELIRLAPVTGAFGSIALSFGLLILYGRQTAVLEQQYQPYLVGEIDARNPVMSQFTVRNTGSDFAYDIEAEWTIDDETNVWERQSLAPNDTVSFPVIVDENGRWMMSTEQIRTHIDENDISPEIEYEIRCKDQFGIPRSFDGNVDIDVTARREESNEIWEDDPVASLANSASNIEASIDAIASDVDDRRDEQEWQNRWTRQMAIINIVQELEEVPIEVLARIIKINESSLDFRLSELEEAGYLHYDEDNGEARLEPSPGNNHTLSEYP